MRLRSSLFGALVPVTPAQSSSCFVPPANPVSVLNFWASVRPLNTQPLAVFDADWYGALPVQVTGLKPFQSNVELTTRFPSSSSKPAALPMGPADAAPPMASSSAPSATTKRSRKSAFEGHILVRFRRWLIKAPLAVCERE